MHSPDFHLFESDCHDPLVLLTDRQNNTISILHVPSLPTPGPSPFPDRGSGDTVGDDGRQPTEADRTALPLGKTWDIQVNPMKGERIEGLDMGHGGKMIVALGSKGSVWLWAAERG